MTERVRYRRLSIFSALLLVIVAAVLVNEEGLMAKKVFVVDIKASRSPVFSGQCAVCMQPQGEPVASLELTATHGRMEYYLYGFTKPYPNEHILQVPVHVTCAKKIRNVFFKHIILIITASVLTGVAVCAGRWGGILSVTLAFVVFAFLLALTVNSPMPVEYSIFRSGEIRFFFRDRAYAEDFASRNGGTVLEGNYLTDYYPG